MQLSVLLFDSSAPGAALSAWLLTYLIHSTVLLVIALLVVRVFRSASNITLEAVWRVAVLGGIITATIAVALPGERALHEFTLSAARPTQPTFDAPAIESPLLKESESLMTAAPWPRPDLGALPADRNRTEAQPIVLSPEAVSTTETLPSGEVTASRLRMLQLIWLPLLGVLGAVWAVVSITLAHDRLRRRLRGRVAIDAEDNVLAMLSALQANLGFTRRVRLWKSSEIDVPMAYGTLRPGICVPTRFLTDLSPDHQRRVLAHELAHLIRRDPLWVGAYRLIACMCFFQPLNWFALKRLRELAEYECDRIAVCCTGGRFGFARCLTEVANWLVADHAPVDKWKTAAMVSSMARSRSNLRLRIDRLVHADQAFAASRKPQRLLVVATFALIGLAMTTLSPRVRAVAADVMLEADIQQTDVVESPILKEVIEADALISALVDIAREIDGLAADIKSLSQRINLLDGGRGSTETDEIMTSLESRLAELRARRYALLESILNERTLHHTSTEDTP